MVDKPRKVIITFNARSSLKKHIQFIKDNVSVETANYVKEGILNKCKNLGDFAGYSIERYLEEEPKEYRSVTQWDYNIIYSIEDKTIRILEIIHTREHPDNRQRAKQ